MSSCAVPCVPSLRPKMVIMVDSTNSNVDTQFEAVQGWAGVLQETGRCRVSFFLVVTLNVIVTVQSAQLKCPYVGPCPPVAGAKRKLGSRKRAYRGGLEGEQRVCICFGHRTHTSATCGEVVKRNETEKRKNNQMTDSTKWWKRGRGNSCA